MYRVLSPGGNFGTYLGWYTYTVCAGGYTHTRAGWYTIYRLCIRTGACTVYSIYTLRAGWYTCTLYTIQYTECIGADTH